MPTIDQDIRAIRMAVYGRDVRSAIADAIEQCYNRSSGGGGGTGTTDYSQLINKPSINSVSLVGNKTLSELGIASAVSVASKYTKPSTGIPASDLASGVIPVVHNVPSGGARGQVLAKASGTSYDLTWTDVSGGGSSTSNYNDLFNKPSINSVTLTGNVTLAQLGINDIEITDDNTGLLVLIRS